MKFGDIIFSLLVVAQSCYATPTPMVELSPINSPETELLVYEGIKLARSQDVEKRVSADFSLERSWNNEVLFGDAWNNTDSSGSEHAKISVTCLECYTHGTVTAKLTGFLDPSLRVGFSGVSAHAFLGVEVDATQTFSINLFASNSPIGIGITGLDVGVVFFVDLVFSLSEAIDLTAGFEVAVPDDAFLEVDLFEGDVDDSKFDGLNSRSLPVTVVSGKATFKADLRLRVQAGAEASLPVFGIGAGAVVGIYANIIEFVAVVEKTPTCDLETEIWWDLNVGAYAHLDVVVDYSTLGPVPTVSTTLLTAPTISSCWVEAPMTTPALPDPTKEAEVSTPAFSSSSPEETGIASITSSAAATSTPATYSTIVRSPSMTLSVSTSKASSTMPSAFHNSSSTAATAGYSYSQIAAGTYPVPSPSAKPTYTSTYTHTLTRCGVPGVINCPATYQSTVIVTRTTMFCPATATTTATSTTTSGSVSASIPIVSSKPTAQTDEVVVIILTALPTPIVKTFVAPPQQQTTSTTTSITTSTTTITIVTSHSINPSNFATPAALVKPIQSMSVSTSGNGTVRGTSVSPVAGSNTNTPLIAGAGHLSVFNSTMNGGLVGAAMGFIVALVIGMW
ncbi:hypothetical protein F4777DRAFT_570988 [Nemania sp. FL0916]|nr:hypothetical protein F4777DRAFT_570988 [Nemania sp. FL0916]